MQGALYAKASDAEVAGAARRVIDTCSNGDSMTGGIGYNIGQSLTSQFGHARDPSVWLSERRMLRRHYRWRQQPCSNATLISNKESSLLGTWPTKHKLRSSSCPIRDR